MNGNELKRILQANNVVLAELAEKLNISPQALSNRLLRKTVKDQFIRDIEEVLGFKLKYDSSVVSSEGCSEASAGGSLEAIALLTSMLQKLENEKAEMRNKYEKRISQLEDLVSDLVKRIPEVPEELLASIDNIGTKKERMVG